MIQKYGQERLKDILEKEAREKEEETQGQEQEQIEDNIDLTVTENERPWQKLTGALDIQDTKIRHRWYVDKVKPHMKVLNEDQLKKMQSTKVTMML